MKTETKRDNVAYSGRYVQHDNKTYMLAPEEQLGSCIGCSLNNQHNHQCPVEAAKFCGQGYILKKVNI